MLRFTKVFSIDSLIFIFLIIRTLDYPDYSGQSPRVRRFDCTHLNDINDFSKTAGLEIVTHWLPMRPKIEHWRLNFQNWSPACDLRFV